MKCKKGSRDKQKLLHRNEGKEDAVIKENHGEEREIKQGRRNQRKAHK
jgi:hypothetical protein